MGLGAENPPVKKEIIKKLENRRKEKLWESIFPRYIFFL